MPMDSGPHTFSVFYESKSMPPIDWSLTQHASMLVCACAHTQVTKECTTEITKKRHSHHSWEKTQIITSQILITHHKDQSCLINVI